MITMLIIDTSMNISNVNIYSNRTYIMVICRIISPIIRRMPSYIIIASEHRINRWLPNIYRLNNVVSAI